MSAKRVTLEVMGRSSDDVDRELGREIVFVHTIDGSSIAGWGYSQCDWFVYADPKRFTAIDEFNRHRCADYTLPRSTSFNLFGRGSVE